MISKLFIWIFSVLIVSCGGGGSNVSSSSTTTNKEHNLNITVVDGYIKNSTLTAEYMTQIYSDNRDRCLRRYNLDSNLNYFSIFEENSSVNAGNYSLRTRNPEFFDGTFVEGTTNFRITAKGGIEVDSNKAMPNLNLINDQVDRYLPNQTSFIISPLTTAEYFFNRNLNNCQWNPVNEKINKILGFSESIDINLEDPLTNLNDLDRIKVFNINNQLTSLVLAMNEIRNYEQGGNKNSDEIFLILTDYLASSYKSNPNQSLSLMSEAVLTNFLNLARTELALALDSSIQEKLLTMLKNMMKLIQYKNFYDANINNLSTNALTKFSKTVFIEDFFKVWRNTDTENVYQYYENNLAQRISQVSGVDQSYLNFQIRTEPLSLTTKEDVSLTINILDSVHYDFNESLTITFQNPTNGTLSKDNANIFTYVPNSNFNGFDYFNYTVKQGSNSQDGYVGITVTPVADKPIFSNISSPINVEEGNTFITNINATDPEGGDISFSLSGNDANSVQISSTGVLTFKVSPNYDVKNSYSFSVIASNGTSQSSINLVVKVINDNSQVDLLIYYAPDMLEQYLTESAIETKAQYQVSSLNNALVRSEADISFNLVKLLPYDIDISNQTAEQILETSISRAKIKQDQILYGADYHVIISRWNINKGQTLGRATIDNKIDETDWDYLAGYSSNWTADSTWQEVGCVICVPDKVFSHELGHNLGSGHWPGSSGQSYAFGHRVDGDSDGDYQGLNDWGTIMSYSDISPDYFSNPEVNCKIGEPCGVLNVSDNTRWYDSYGARFSDILPRTYLNNSNSGKKINVKDFFPKINGGSSLYSNGGTQRTFNITSLGTTSISGKPYETFKWENSVSGNSKMAFHFFERNGAYFFKRSDYESGYYFSGVDEYTLYDENNLCTFMEAFKTIGNYLSRTCKNAYAGNPPIYNDTYHFTNFIKEETLTVPYGTYNTTKFVFALWDNSLYPLNPIAYLMHVVFWLNNEVGIVQYRDHLGRIWKLESADSDGDGQDNKTDSDDDNDGVLDINDAFKLDPDASIDSNSDGIPD